MFFRRRDLSVSWVIAFLGNPGLRYENTRHNVGFLVSDIVETKVGAKIKRIKYNSLTAIATLGEQRVFLIKPQTYMNLSGGPVRQAMKFYKVPLSNVIAVTDDVALPVGKLRIRRSGSSGGHNGLKDIISKCGGEAFPRIRIGVGSSPSDGFEMADWVLSKFSPDDEKLIQDAVTKAADALEAIVNTNIEKAMGKFN